MTLAARIAGVGLVGPGLASWEAARAILAGREPYQPRPTVMPPPDALPATERRRAGKCVRLALAAGLAAAADAALAPADLVAIFASSSGDGENLHNICETLASDDRDISPTRFHNSVHNAPAGYWGIATGATHPADSLAAFDATFAAGLLEALGRLATTPARPVLLIAYDAPYPEPLNAKRPMPDAFAAAFVLADARSGPGPKITLEARPGPPSAMESAPLEALRAAIPAARSLPLLVQIARGTPGRVAVDYLDGRALALDVAP